MLLSDVLKEMRFSKYKIKREVDFDVLALVGSETLRKACVFLDDSKYINSIKENVCMVLMPAELEESVEASSSYKGGICIVEQPRLLFFEIHNYLQKSQEYVRPVFKTQIGSNCSINPLSSISENNVIIGNNVIIEEFVVIRENTIIGDGAVIRAGAKIGGEGFEFKRTDKKILSVKHLGGVKIGENVEIQYNSCIDKAVYPWDDTVIGDFSKIDNLVHIGHAVKIDNNVMVVAQSGIGGRTKIGHDTWIGFASTVSNGLRIGEKARVNIGSVATKDVPTGESVSGNFAIEHSKFIENLKKMIKE